MKKGFQIYYDFRKVAKIQDYRVLALNRGEKLGVLKVYFEHNLDKMARFSKHVLRKKAAGLNRWFKQL